MKRISSIAFFIVNGVPAIPYNNSIKLKEIDWTVFFLFYFFLFLP